MKAYMEPNQMRLVGKAWEIKYYLKKVASPSVSLQDFLQSHCAHSRSSDTRRPKLTILK
jgi:hypothetical protein